MWTGCFFPIRTPTHAESPIAAPIGDHEPAHAYRSVLFFLLRGWRTNSITSRMHELRRHRPYSGD